MQKLLLEKLKNLPQKPGVYIFKDAKGLILYVGKAVKLKNRVNSYFKKDGGDNRGARIEIMISQIADIDYTVTDNETEALILEKSFINQLKPKYNIDLRDDKNYLFVKINLRDKIPTIGYERKTGEKGAKYFGPYTSSLAIKDTLRWIRRIFPYCANKKVGTKPCFYYHIGKCPGVCFGKISVAEYRNNYIKKIMQFLEGRLNEIQSQLKLQMKGYAQARLFEKAAKVRDQIFALNRVLERQKLVYTTNIDQDVFSLYQDSVAVVNLFQIRMGKLVQKENFVLENAKQLPAAEIFEQFLPRYYLDASSIPKEILLPVKINEEELKPAFTKLPKIIQPSRGKKFDLIKLGVENARQHLESTTDKKLLEGARLLSSLKELQRVLNLPELPARIEAYDISNIQGTNPVGSMVVFDFARPKKDAYRKFKINKKQTPDDFAMMREMLSRRLRNDWPRPNLILIDGGKGQLNAAIAALKMTNSKLQIPILGLAKRLEEIFLPGQKNPVILPGNSIGLFLLQRIRDEAHRFAVKYHRHLRSKNSLTSVLDGVSGIGQARKKLLLQKFGSTSRIRGASLTDLAAIVGSKTAEKLKASL